MKQVNTGGLAFRNMRGNDKYYVDKTLLIKDILDRDDMGIFLYVRPRRFGKTTNLTMLDAFFNIEYDGNDWFDGLAISEFGKYSRHRNAYPVVRIDLKDLNPDSPESLMDSLNGSVIRAMDPFTDILESDGMSLAERTTYERVATRTASGDEITGSIRMLTEVLHRHHGRRAIVLIDEYDRAVTDAFGKGSQSDILSILGRFMSSTLKSNDSLQMAYITGVMQVAKAGMFSGLNNLTVDNVFSTISDERFGFTEPEVRGILKYFGHEEKFDEVRSWYDGYRFGNAEVYNPFSVMMYVQSGFVPKSYWMGTSRDNPIRLLMGREDMSVFTTLLSGASVESALHDTMSYEELNLQRDGDLFSLMVMTGYLKAVPLEGSMYRLSIPNGEVMEVLDRMVSENVRIDGRGFSSFCAAILDADAARVETTLRDILAGSSYMGTDRGFPYEVLLLTIMRGLLTQYEVEMEREHGNGRADLYLRHTRPGIPDIVIELKVASGESVLDAYADEAVAQIRGRRYALGAEGRAVLVGIAFWGKVPKVRIEVDG